MMNNAWRMNEGANKRWNDKGWGTQVSKGGNTASQQAKSKEFEANRSRGGNEGPTRTRGGNEGVKRSAAPGTAE